MKKFLFIALATIILHHLFCTILYLSPPNLIKQKLNGYVYSYMVPIFSQDWHLFSPNPGITFTRIAIKCENQPWHDPTESIQKSHRMTRVLGYGKLLSVYEDLSKRVKTSYSQQLEKCAKEKCSEALFLERLRSKDDVKTIRKLANQFCTEKLLSKFTSVKLLEFFPKKYTDRNNEIPWSRVSEYKL